MTNKEVYDQAFIDSFALEKEMLDSSLKYQGVPGWDSVGHMSLIAAIEEGFSITLETDDVIDFSSYEHGKDIVKKYGVSFDD